MVNQPYCARSPKYSAEDDKDMPPNIGLRSNFPNRCVVGKVFGDDKRAECGNQVQAPGDGGGRFTAENQCKEYHDIAEMAYLQGDNAGAQPFAQINIDVSEQ